MSIEKLSSKGELQIKLQKGEGLTQALERTFLEQGIKDFTKKDLIELASTLSQQFPGRKKEKYTVGKKEYEAVSLVYAGEKITIGTPLETEVIQPRVNNQDIQQSLKLPGDPMKEIENLFLQAGYTKTEQGVYRSEDLIIEVKNGKIEFTRGIGRIFGSWGLNLQERALITKVGILLHEKNKQSKS